MRTIVGRMGYVLASLLLVLGTRASADERLESVDGFLTQASVVPQAGTVRLSLGGGGIPIEGGTTEASLSALWSFHRSFAAVATGVYEGGTLVPALELRWQPLEQLRSGVNLTTLLRYKTQGFFPNAGEVELGAALGGKVGSMQLTGNVVVGHEVDSFDAGADAEAHASALWSLTKAIAAGLDARFRTSIEPDKVDQQGLAWDVVAGPTLAFSMGMFRVQAIAGYSAGHGLNLGVQRPGPFGLAMLSADL